MILETIKGIFLGVGQGILVAALGYAKSAGEDFDEKKFAQTVIVGGFIGGVAGAMQMGYDEAKDYLVTMGGIVLFEYLKKTVWRRWLSKYFKE